MAANIFMGVAVPSTTDTDVATDISETVERSMTSATMKEESEDVASTTAEEENLRN